VLNIQKFPLNQPEGARIRRWLGGEGAIDFLAWLVTRDAILTAEAGVLMVESGETPSKADEAREKANEAAGIRRFIDLINEARQNDFQFERCEITPATVATK
jgi:hypothetical protein